MEGPTELPSYALSLDALNRSFGKATGSSWTDSGWTEEQAAKQRTQFGLNELRRKAAQPAWKRLVAQFQGLMIALLVLAAIIAGALGEWIDTFVILAIVVLNGLLGFFQEERAEQALEALRSLSSPQAKVRRDGQVRVVAASQLVPGDIIELEAGDYVPADARLLVGYSLQVQESSLTGESTAVEKKADAILTDPTPIGDRCNMLFLGTTVVAGKAAALVTATGMETELGQIAHLLQDTAHEQTPLQRRLAELGRVMVTICLAIVAVIFLLQWLRGGNLWDVFLTSVSLAVAAVPEGLPAVVTVTLAIGLQRMAKRHALVRKLPSVETLGCVTVICSDKTGTLTRNEMTVREAWSSTGQWLVQGEGYSPQGSIAVSSEPANSSLFSLQLLAYIAKACNNSSWTWLEQESKAQIIGDPTEIALHVFAHKTRAHLQSNLDSFDAHHQESMVHENPFDSDRKMMSQVYRTSTGSLVMFAKGASEVILDRSTHIIQGNILNGESELWGEATPLDQQQREEIIAETTRMSERALRVLAFAYRPIETDASTWSSEDHLVFVGLIGMIDPPRKEAADAVARCREAGIKPVMITGDHPRTALAIARSLSIATVKDGAITGEQLDQLSDEQLKDRVVDTSVYARVSAQHKLRVVQAWKSRGDVVAMTGDGVNDAPAVKMADIGIVMGITGTDVTKEAADMVLTDDNFVSIVNAVEEGRGIYENIQKFLHFLLACNASEVIFMFAAAMIGWPSPLLAIQILWINLVTDGIPALALAMEPIDHDLMSHPPRSLRQSILPWSRGRAILLHGFLMAAVSLIGFGLVYRSSPESLEQARTAAFCIITLSQVFFSMGCRSFRKTMPELGPFSNPYLLAALFFSVAIQVAVVSIPWTAHILETTPISWKTWGWVLGLALVPVTVIELAKLVSSQWKTMLAKRKP